MALTGAFTNVRIQGSNKKRIMIILVLISVYYYFYYYRKGKTLTSSDIQTFLGDSIFIIALQNTPLIFL